MAINYMQLDIWEASQNDSTTSPHLGRATILAATSYCMVTTASRIALLLSKRQNKIWEVMW